MCDPVTVGIGLAGAAVGSQMSKPKAPKAAPLPDPAEERAAAEADAQQRANAQLAADQRRRREQQNLLSRGATEQTGVTFGDTTLTDEAGGPMTGGSVTSRSTVAKRSPSLLGRGASSGGGARSGASQMLQ